MKHIAKSIRSLYFNALCIIFCLTLSSKISLADSPTTESSSTTWSGQLSIVGSQLNSRLILRNNETNESKRICPGETSQRISQLAGMTVEINGSIQKGASQRQNCIQTTNFTILKTTTGRPAAVGLLERDEDGYFLNSNGSGFRLSRMLPGMEKLVGEYIIISVDNQAALRDNTIQPMSFMAFPK